MLGALPSHCLLRVQHLLRLDELSKLARCKKSFQLRDQLFEPACRALGCSSSKGGWLETYKHLITMDQAGWCEYTAEEADGEAPRRRDEFSLCPFTQEGYQHLCLFGGRLQGCQYFNDTWTVNIDSPVCEWKLTYASTATS